jgi:hypothetical protein
MLQECKQFNRAVSWHLSVIYLAMMFCIILDIDHIGGVMISVLPSSVVDSGF